MARDMKDSGIEWIGKIPVEWNVRPIKNSFSIVSGSTPNSDKAEYWDGDIAWITPADFKTIDKYTSGGSRYITKEGYNSCSTSIIPKGSIIFSKRAPIGSVVINTIDLCTNQGCLSCIKNDKTDSVFFYYIMSVYDDVFNQFGSGTTFKEISATTFSDFILPLPPLEEQKLISSFLDSKCSKIDKAIEATKASIEEYKKLKQAIITEAVTKGLVPNVDMKDSGIDWLGKVPISWKVVKLKNCLSIERGGSPRPIDAYLTDEIDGLNWIKIGDTEKGKRYISSVKQKIKKEGLSKTRQVHAGDLLLTNSMSFGEPYILQVDGCIHDGWLVFSNVKNIDKVFLYYFLVSKSCMDQFIMSADGGVVQNLNIEKVRSAIIVIPSIEEQKDIVYHLDTKCSEIDSLIKSKEKLIEELTAYRKSLIYEYVTGKKEVPAI